MFPSFYSKKGGPDVTRVKNGIISARHPETAAAGLKVLERGGNAVDAAVTAALASCVVEPYMTGIGGGGDAVIYMSGNRESHAVDFWGVTPKRIKPDFYEVNPNEIGDPILSWCSVKGEENLRGHKSAVVPGMVLGLSEMLERFGTIGLDEALRPAIRLAEQGTFVDFQLSALIGAAMSSLIGDKDLSSLFLKHGSPKRPWCFELYQPDKLVQRSLGQTLRKIAKDGADVFYRGEIAEAISSDMEKHGGLIDSRELSTYRPYWCKTTPGTYRGHDLVYLPGGGGTFVVQMLNVLEEYEMGKGSAVDPRTIHLLIRVMRMAFRDILGKMGGEPSQSLLSSLVSKEYAARLRSDLEEPIPVSMSSAGPVTEHTTSLTVVDENRNAVSMTTSVGLLFGAVTMVPGTGINLNDLMICSDPVPGRPLSIRPGRRQFFPPTPFIVLKDDRPFVVTAAAGGCRIIPAVLRVITNVIDFGMNVFEAQNAPRVAQAGRDLGPTFVDSRLGRATVEKLRRMGDVVQPADPEFSFGITTGIVVDPDGSLTGAAERNPPYGFDGTTCGF